LAAEADLQGTLVFQASHGGLFHAYDLASGRLWPLTTGFDPAISPDGQRVAFTRDGGENGIYVIDIDGSDQRLIFSGRATLAAPKWSPDGAWIVFSRGDEYVECYDFGRNLCLTEDELPDRLPPGLLDDLPLVKQYKQKLALVDANGGNYRDLPSLESARTPDWSDRGIVYQSKAGLQWTADTPGAENRLISFDYLKPFYHDPDWQPGSDRIAFMSKEASHWEIFTVNADGSGMTALTRPVTALVDEIPSNVAPAWSPDGRAIVYLSNRGEDNSAGAWRLWVMDADGSNQRPLPIDVPIEYTFGDEQAVSWGP
jgi:dipeptidyl aminopeptidase/acylaminoacyl peptidase